MIVGRGAEHRTHSADSSLLLETKVGHVKSGTLQKPPGSAPPSILVKPDMSKGTSEKQVKTVRFQNYSPPPSKRQGSLSSPSAENGRPEQGLPETANQEVPLVPEMAGVYHQRANSAPVQQMDNRRTQGLRTLSLDLTSPPTPVNYPSMFNFNEN